MFNIAVVEDDSTISEGIKYALTKKGYTCHCFYTGQSFLDNVYNLNIDLTIMDIMLPDKNGFCVSEEYLGINNSPIIFLTARDGIEDKLRGLGLGAEDYLTKPFDLRELLMRIEIVLRRNHKKHAHYKINEDTILNEDSKSVFMKGQLISLTPKEYDLLIYFIENKGIVLSRDKLIEKVWGYDFDGDERTVDINVTRLRKKLNLDSKKQLITVFGMGYKYED